MKLVSLIFTFFSVFGSFAQNEEIVLNLSATEFNGKVLLTWSVVQGNTCNGIDVLRSQDSLNFTEIGSIEGICGSTLASIAYEFTDPNPVQNVTNYYRISLGGIGFSYIVQVDVINTGDQEFLVKPNPIEASSLLFFSNDNNGLVNIEVFDEFGAKVKTYETSEQSILLNPSDYSSGVHFFVITREESSEQVKGKFVVN